MVYRRDLWCLRGLIDAYDLYLYSMQRKKRLKKSLLLDIILKSLQLIQDT